MINSETLHHPITVGIFKKQYTMIQKMILALAIVSVGTLATAQPRCFIVGPAYNMGNTTIDGFSFTRTYNANGMDGAPTTEFSGLGSAKTKNSAAGLYTDIYLKRCRIGFDLMFPFKNSGANVLNFNLAFGGYIKGKVGILAGVSFYQNTKNLELYPTDVSYTSLSLSSEVNSSGNFYNDANMAGAGGFNLLLTYAHNETLVVRFDYGFYLGGITHKKSGEPENYDWNQTGSRKIEIGAVWQFHENFGLAAKFFTWTSSGTYDAEIEYTDMSGNTSEKEIAIFPERTYKSTNFTISLMIPLGGAEATSGRISVVE